jgi:hypothetical protein
MLAHFFDHLLSKVDAAGDKLTPAQVKEALEQSISAYAKTYTEELQSNPLQ